MELGNRKPQGNSIVIETISKVRQAIMSIPMEEEWTHDKMEDLYDLTKLVTSLNIAKASINTLISEDHLTED